SAGTSRATATWATPHGGNPGSPVSPPLADHCSRQSCARAPKGYGTRTLRPPVKLPAGQSPAPTTGTSRRSKTPDGGCRRIPVTADEDDQGGIPPRPAEDRALPALHGLRHVPPVVGERLLDHGVQRRLVAELERLHLEAVGPVGLRRGRVEFDQHPVEVADEL